ARAETDLSDVLHERGLDADALELARSAARTFSELADRPKANRVHVLLATFAWNNVAQAARGCGQDEVATKAVEEALRRADQGLNPTRRASTLGYTRAWARLEAGRAAKDAKAAAALDEAVDALEQLVREFPRTATFGRKLADALTDRGRRR